MTFIYQLCDPDSGLPFYVGKGSSPKRPFTHWSAFISRGCTVNRGMFRWFFDLQLKNQKPIVRVVEDNVTDWEKAEREQITLARTTNPELTNVLAGGNCPPPIAGVLGGRAHKGWTPTEEARSRMGKAFLGKSLSTAHRQKISTAVSKARVGMKFTVEHCLNMSKSRSKLCNDPIYRKKLSDAQLRRNSDPSIGDKIRAGQLVNPEKLKFRSRLQLHNRWHKNRGITNSTCNFCVR